MYQFDGNTRTRVVSCDTKIESSCINICVTIALYPHCIRECSMSLYRFKGICKKTFFM